MSFNPYAGSSGRIKQIAVAADLTVPTPTLTGLTTTTVAGITGWDIETSTDDGGGITHFESPANSQGVLFTQQLQGGVGKWSARVSGIYDSDTTSGAATHARLKNGGFVVADFIYSKATAFGRAGNAGKVKNYSERFDHKANATTFTCTIEGHGTLSDPAVIS